jgi:hypothetical protein
MEIDKGEELQWLIEDKNTLLLRRVRQKLPRKLKVNP